MRKRDERRKVMLNARMLSDKGWSEVAVCDLSRRGLMVVADTPLKPGSFIEIRRARYTIVARIVWTNGGRIGLRAQDPIDVSGLIAAAAGAAPGESGKSGDGYDRRSAERRLSDRVAQGQHFSSRFQYVLLLAVAAVSAWLILDAMSQWLASPLKIVRRALGSPE